MMESQSRPDVQLQQQPINSEILIALGIAAPIYPINKEAGFSKDT